MCQTESKYVRRLKQRHFNKRLVANIKRGKRCMLCNKPDLELTFHHVNPSTKISDISSLVSKPASSTKLMAEINKCILICVACHRSIHSTRTPDTGETASTDESLHHE